MSHNATNWAIQQRGLRPATKLVLWHLADRHNKDTSRCDPSQDMLADDCEMSRSALNEHLKILEERGLIRRVQRIDSDTKRQKSTSYIFAFDFDRQQDIEKPCPENGHGAVSGNDEKPCPENGDFRVRNPDTNPVKEPVREPAAARETFDLDSLTVRLLDAVGEKIQPHGAIVLAPILGLLDGGCDLETDILPTIRARAARMTRPAGSWSYFVAAIREAYEQRIAAGRGLSQPKSSSPTAGQWEQHLPPAEQRVKWQKTLNMARGPASWKSWLWGPPPGQPGCRVPPDLLEPRDLRIDWFEENSPEAA